MEKLIYVFLALTFTSVTISQTKEVSDIISFNEQELKPIKREIQA